MNEQKHQAYATDSHHWDVVARRDPLTEGAFFYAVKTTGIYCRPGCSSRLPNQANVVFFASAKEAQQAGFRACKRCRPDVAQGRDRHRQAIVRACQLIDAAEQPLSLQELAAAVCLSPYHFHRVFKRLTGITPKQYATARQAGRFQEKLTENLSVTQAIYAAGFGSSSRVYESSTGLLGMTPSHYKKGAAAIEIRFTVAQTFLGWMLVAATEKGICAIQFGDAPDSMIAHLRERFPKANLREDKASFADWVAQVVAFIEAPRHSLDLPLDIQGTAFQQRVWRALRAIPLGKTASYTEIAKQVGNPKAVRAVAQACAANAIAVAIPCHRVIHSDGSLSGYRWGIERKRALLEREAAEHKADLL